MGILSLINPYLEHDADSALQYIAAYEKEYPWDCMIETARAAAFFVQGEYTAAYSSIRSALERNPANYLNHYYLALICDALGRYSEAIKACMVSWNFAAQFGQSSEEMIKPLNELLLQLTQNISEDELPNIIRYKNITQTPGSFFPLYFNINSNRWTVYQGDFLYFDHSSTYNDYVCGSACAYTDSITYTFTHVLAQSGQYNIYARFSAEIWKGLQAKQITLPSHDSVIALTATAPGQSFEVRFPDHTLRKFTLEYPNIYHYLRFHTGGEISSETPFIISKPVPLGPQRKNKRLVLCIFEDAISMEYLKSTDFKDMPYTKEFFSKGTIFEHAYSTAEWTHPSFASLFTGLYSTHHHVNYRSSCYKFPMSTKTISEIFSEHGYFTTSINSSVGLSPYIGGTRGFDRSVVKSCMGFRDHELVADALSAMEAFKDTNHFLMLSLFDVHRVLDDIGDNILSLDMAQQTLIDAKVLLKRVEKTKSVQTPFSSEGTLRYGLALQQADLLLQQIYRYISDHYSEDEYEVCLFSDHGVSFLDDDPDLLKKNQTNTLLMLRGGNIPAMRCGEYIGHFDYIPILTHAAGIPFDFSQHDCRLPECFGGEGRPISYSESIYPGQTYKAILRNSDYEYHFESIAHTDFDGRIDLSDGCTATLYHKKDRTICNDEVVLGRFEQEIDEHIRYNLKF